MAGRLDLIDRPSGHVPGRRISVRASQKSTAGMWDLSEGTPNPATRSPNPVQDGNNPLRGSQNSLSDR